MLAKFYASSVDMTHAAANYSGGVWLLAPPLARFFDKIAQQCRSSSREGGKGSGDQVRERERATARRKWVGEPSGFGGVDGDGRAEGEGRMVTHGGPHPGDRDDGWWALVGGFPTQTGAHESSAAAVIFPRFVVSAPAPSFVVRMWGSFFFALVVVGIGRETVG